MKTPNCFLKMIMSIFMVVACTNLFATTLLPEEWVVVEFVFEEPPMSIIGPIDFMWNQQGGSFFDVAEGDYVEYFLYDEETLLSTTTTTSAFCCHFRKEPSLWSPSNSIPIDFSSFIDGTIRGTFVMKPFFGSPTQYASVSFSDFHFITGTSIGPGMYWPGPDAVIVSCKIQVGIFADGFEITNTKPC